MGMVGFGVECPQVWPVVWMSLRLHQTPWSDEVEESKEERKYPVRKIGEIHRHDKMRCYSSKGRALSILELKLSPIL